MVYTKRAKMAAVLHGSTSLVTTRQHLGGNSEYAIIKKKLVTYLESHVTRAQ